MAGGCTKMDRMKPKASAVALAVWSIAGSAAAEPVRMATTAFGTSAEIEIRGLARSQAEEAATRALQEIFTISGLADPSGAVPGGVGALNAAAGKGPQDLAEQTVGLLVGGLQMCVWSSGAHGPLGGELYRVWRQGSGRSGPGLADRWPNTEELRAAVLSADCRHLSLGGDPVRAEIPAGSRVDTSWLARGYAIDRAVDKLREHGVENAWLEIGPVHRAMGPGPDGLGWLLTLPNIPGTKEPIDELWLEDQAVAFVTRPEDGGPRQVELLDQRSGVPPQGVLAVVVVADRAWDAEGLAAALYICGVREGQLRLGGYQPRPSIFWLLGQGQGKPLQSTYRWSELRRVPRR